MDWQVCLWHGSTKRFFSGRSVNISATGALLQMPLTIPIRMAEVVEFNFTPPIDQNADQFHSKVFSAKVVRVNRGESLLDANQSVALKFA
jgi:hypothetical protein